MRIGERCVPQGSGGPVFRRFAALFTVLLFITAIVIVSGPAEARRYASIVIDEETGVVLHEAHADREIYPASLTKMMTLYLLFEALEDGTVTPEQKLPVSRRAAGQPPTNLRLDVGDTITVKKAIRALIIQSANDVATVVAEALGGTEAKFARMMTEKARELGMMHTTYRNASGLPNRHQVSTARDIATLARALMRDFPGYYHLFSEESFTYHGRTYKTHNHLVTDYPGADGLKTGYIRAAGFNVATSAVRYDRRLIAVVIGGRTAKSRDVHTAKLLNHEFAAIAAGDVPAITMASVPLVVPPAKPETPESGIAIAMSALVPSAKAAVPDTPLAGRWGIQVGAFSEFAPAQMVARKAAHDAASILQDAHVVVHERPQDDRTLYRSRIIGLTEDDAEAACKLLKAKDTPCLVVRLENNVALSRAQ